MGILEWKTYVSNISALNINEQTVVVRRLLIFSQRFAVVLADERLGLVLDIARLEHEGLVEELPLVPAERLAQHVLVIPPALGWKKENLHIRNVTIPTGLCWQICRVEPDDMIPVGLYRLIKIWCYIMKMPHLHQPEQKRADNGKQNPKSAQVR